MALSLRARLALGVAMREQAAANEMADALDATAALSAAESAFLDGAVAGTAAASKVLVLGSAKEVGTVGDATIDTSKTLAVTTADKLTVGGVIVVVPDASDVERVMGEFDDARQAGVASVLTADQGPERRYREFVRILRGGARLVVGTRASVFAPVPDLRLIVVWDDGDDALVVGRRGGKDLLPRRAAIGALGKAGRK